MGGTNSTTKGCSKIVAYGLDSTFRNYIQSVTWYLKGYNANTFSKQNFYLCERGQSTDTTNCMSGNSGAYASSTTANIGLMYASDYLYASSYFSSTDTTSASYLFGKNNWLYKSHEWTITPVANTDTRVFAVYRDSKITSADDGLAYSIRPTFYLKSSVSITGGDGSFTNPYTLSI